MSETATEDRYRSMSHTVREVLNDPNYPEGTVERMDVRLLASGEATWRVWLAREEEPTGGYMPPVDQDATS